MKAKPTELLLSVAVLILGLGVAVGASQLSSAGGYARIGPNAAPAVIAGGLILLGIWLVYEAITGGWRNAVPDDPTERGEHSFHIGGFIWVSIGLIAQIFLIQPLASCSPKLRSWRASRADSAVQSCRVISPSVCSWVSASFSFSLNF